MTDCAGVVLIRGEEPHPDDPGPWHAFGQTDELWIERCSIGYRVRGCAQTETPSFNEAFMDAYGIWMAGEGKDRVRGT